MTSTLALSPARDTVEPEVILVPQQKPVVHAGGAVLLTECLGWYDKMVCISKLASQKVQNGAAYYLGSASRGVVEKQRGRRD